MRILLKYFIILNNYKYSINFWEMEKRFPSAYKFVLTILILGLLVTGIIIKNNQEKAFIGKLSENLVSITDLKVTQFDNWLNNIIFEGDFIAKNRLTEDEFKAFIKDKKSYKEDIIHWCKFLTSSNRISNVYLYNTSGMRIYSFPDTSLHLENIPLQRFKKIYEIKSPELTAFHKTEPIDSSYHLDLFVPMFDSKTDKLYGIFVLKIDMNRGMQNKMATIDNSKPLLEYQIAALDSINPILFKYDSENLLTSQPIENINETFKNFTPDSVRRININDEKYLEYTKKIPGTNWYWISRINISEPLLDANIKFLCAFISISFFVLLIAGVVFFFWHKQHSLTLDELSKTEKEKSDLNHRLSLFMKYANDIIIMMEESGKIAEVNKRALEFYGYSEEEIYKLNIRDLRAPETIHDVEEKMKRVIDEDGLVFETLHKTQSGEIKAVEVSARKLYITGKFYFQSIVRDITERKKANELLIESKLKAEESERVKSNFLANMSHELRTPLNGILGFSEILQEETKEENTKKMARVIHNNGIRLLTTLNMVLDLSRLEASKVNPQILPVNVCKILDESTTLYRTVAERKGLNLIHECKCENQAIINTDESLLHKIINNLINNAVKFTQKGEIEIKFSKTVLDEMDAVEIKVIDTGIGIPEEYLEVIFDDFRQVSEGLGRNFEGTGLGLTIVRDYIKLLKGKIEVESEPGVGSTFTITVPSLKSDKNILFNREMRTNLTKQTLKEGEKLNILYVENDEDCRLIVKTILKDFCNIEYAGKGDEAIEMAKANNYLLILMDINLGKGIDGIETAKKVREISGYENIPIIALTAFAMKGDREEFLSGGCTHYISKPFRKDDLRNLVLKIKESL